VNPEHSFIDLKEKLGRGDPAAGEEIFRRYAQQLVRVVSPRVVGSLRQKVDPEDIVQSAFRSFFRAGPAEAFETQGWNDLWAVLVTITLRKCRYQVRHFLTAKRNLKKEVAGGSPDSSADWQFVASEPTPAEAAELTDLVKNFLDSLDERNRTIAEMAMAGATPADIARQLGLTERTIYRQLERIRERLELLDH
jgi:RNA polymerase sigma-70 factor, ECF subfamily